MGRIAPNYFVQDGVIPRTRLPEVLGPHRRAGADEYGLHVANVFHAGDGNLHPLVCYDGRERGRGRARRGAGRADRRRLPGRRRLDHRRARRRRGQEAHMPKMFDEADLDAFQRLRCAFDPDGLRQPGQGDADAAAVRRGARPLPAAPAGAGRAGGALLMATEPRRRDARLGGGAGGRAARGGRRRPAGARARRRHQAAAGRGRRASPSVELSTAGLDRILEHNAGDFTAVLEAGVPLAEAQAAFAEAGPDARARPARHGGATIGGIVATADSGPLRHRYGGVRDLVVGITVALSDGTRRQGGRQGDQERRRLRPRPSCSPARSGRSGRSLEVSVRLHPLAARHRHRRRRQRRPGRARAAAPRRSRTPPLEADCLDVALGATAQGGCWRASAARRRGRRPRRAASACASAGPRRSSWSRTTSELWARAARRAARRGPARSCKVSGRADRPARAARASAERTRADAGRPRRARACRGCACATGRRPRGCASALRRRAPRVVLDAPADVRERCDPWGAARPRRRSRSCGASRSASTRPARARPGC